MVNIPLELGAFVQDGHARGELIVQPRMGMDDPADMADGLRAVMESPALAVGTITLDSYTRIGDYEGVQKALHLGRPLNGYPIVSHGAETTSAVISKVNGSIPIQVRHGSSQPMKIFRAMLDAGLSATEGGPVSYCLPYGRTPLAESVAYWKDATSQLAEGSRSRGLRAHLETFGGCLLGQLCPPSLLLAISVLESLFFVQRGIDSVSLSYAQQTHEMQDLEALSALRILAGELLPQHVSWHIVLYTYMGVYPRSAAGAIHLLERSAELAVRGRAERLIVKTASEAWRIPTVAENIDALIIASDRAKLALRSSDLPWANRIDYEDVLAEARTLIEAVLELSDDIGQALLEAFSVGLLDVPFCLHKDNMGLTQTVLAKDGRLMWAKLGNLPLRADPRQPIASPIRSSELLDMLQFTARRVDRELEGSDHNVLDAGGLNSRFTL